MADYVDFETLEAEANTATATNPSETVVETKNVADVAIAQTSPAQAFRQASAPVKRDPDGVTMRGGIVSADAQVRAVQSFLGGGLKADGIFGEKSGTALHAFLSAEQEKLGLKPDGHFSPELGRAMLNATKPEDKARLQGFVTALTQLTENRATLGNHSVLDFTGYGELAAGLTARAEARRGQVASTAPAPLEDTIDRENASLLGRYPAPDVSAASVTIPQGGQVVRTSANAAAPPPKPGEIMDGTEFGQHFQRAWGETLRMGGDKSILGNTFSAVANIVAAPAIVAANVVDAGTGVASYLGHQFGRAAGAVYSVLSTPINQLGEQEQSATPTTETPAGVQVTRAQIPGAPRV